VDRFGLRTPCLRSAQQVHLRPPAHPRRFQVTQGRPLKRFRLARKLAVLIPQDLLVAARCPIVSRAFLDVAYREALRSKLQSKLMARSNPGSLFTCFTNTSQIFVHPDSGIGHPAHSSCWEGAYICALDLTGTVIPKRILRRGSHTASSGIVQDYDNRRQSLAWATYGFAKSPRWRVRILLQIICALSLDVVIRPFDPADGVNLPPS